MSSVLLRFRDLKARGVVNNYPTLYRWIEHEGFPPGMMLGPNSRAWRESEIDDSPHPEGAASWLHQDGEGRAHQATRTNSDYRLAATRRLRWRGHERILHE